VIYSDLKKYNYPGLRKWNLPFLVLSFSCLFVTWSICFPKLEIDLLKHVARNWRIPEKNVGTD
jgi:hypothetical protein